MILGFFFLAIIIWDFEMQTWALVLISMFNDLAVMLTAFDKVRQPGCQRAVACLLPTSVSTLLQHISMCIWSQF